ncbi:MAG: porin [Verrucomicrobia bacterium]|nr:porin [bacterium]NDD57167.1 porin [Verrucomicrobiota bacterium]NDD82259.1 porin [Verrucomicrobiota bacterium]
MNKLIVEFIGTFFLVQAVGFAALTKSALGAVAIGLMLMVMVYAGGHISGAHYNPAVTLAVWLRGKLPKAEVLPYIASQVAGAVVSAVLITKFRGQGSETLLTHPLRVAGAEFLGTFALVWVVLNVATAKGTAGNSFYGAAIGMTVGTGALLFGGISGAVFNPAVAVAGGILNLLPLQTVALYTVVCTVAGLAAAKLFLKVDKR